MIDRNRCEGKADCVRVCPVGVFAVDTLPPAQRRWQVGAFVPAPTLFVPDEEEAAREQIMLEHYAGLEERGLGEPLGRSRP